MKTLLVALTAVAILAVGTMAFAHTSGGWSGGHMMGGYMMGPGHGNHMGGWGWNNPSQNTEINDQKFLDETAELRKELHDKKFEYFEAQRDPDTTNGQLTKLEKEINEISENIYKDAPNTAFRGR